MNRCESVFAIRSVVNLIEHFTIVIYDTRGVLTTNLPITTLEL